MLISYTKVPNDERNKLILSYQSTFFVLPSKVPSKLPSKVPSKVRKKGTFESRLLYHTFSTLFRKYIKVDYHMTLRR